MKCPHCIVEINPNFTEHYLGGDSERFWSVYTMNCPNPKCNKMIIDLASGEPRRNEYKQPQNGLSKVGLFNSEKTLFFLSLSATINNG